MKSITYCKGCSFFLSKMTCLIFLRENYLNIHCIEELTHRQVTALFFPLRKIERLPSWGGGEANIFTAPLPLTWRYA